MIITKTAKEQLYPSDAEKAILVQTLHVFRDVCNYISHFAYTMKRWDYRTLHECLYYDIRTRFRFPSQMTCNALRTVTGAYKSLTSNGYEWTECRFKAPRLTLSEGRDYALKENLLSVGTLNGRIKLKYSNEGMEPYFDRSVYSFGAANLVYKHGKFYLHISIHCEIQESDKSEITYVVGHDRGIRFLVTSYGGNRNGSTALDGKTTFVSGKTVKQKRAHYKKIRQELQTKKTPSSRRRLKAIGHRENRWMRDVNHCVSKALVKDCPKGTLHVIEDLTGIRSATERVRTKDRYLTVSWAYRDLEQKLVYKAKDRGQSVIRVSPKYTSQKCPVCGHTERENRKQSMHVFCCKKCGYQSNDDRIGAMNLYRMGIEYLVEPQSGISGL